MEVFWVNGFYGSSLDSLEEGTGLNRSSLYNSFGGKLGLFCQVLDAYRAGPSQPLFGPIRRERGATALRAYFDALRTFVRSPLASRGCLMLNTSLEPCPDPAVRQRVDAHFRTLRNGFKRCYDAALEDGAVNPDFTAKEAADWLMTFVRGILAGAAAGERPTVLERSINAGMRQLGL